MGRAKNSLSRDSVSSIPIKLRYSNAYTTASVASFGITTGSALNYTNSVNLSSAEREQLTKYRLAKQLYYNVSINSSTNTSSYFDPMWQSTAASASKDETIYNFPVSQISGDKRIFLYCIPGSEFGEQISRKSFIVSSSGYYIVDDGNGNLFDQKTNSHIGNIFYAQGVAVLTNQSYLYPIDSISNTNFNLSFTSEITVYQNEVRCLINENDFNYTLNPSANKINTSGSYIDAVTGSDFRPYFTTVGLYNDADELLLVGKMSRPYPVPQNSDMTVVIRWDS